MIQSILSSFFLSTGIDITNLNTIVGNALGIGSFAGGMLISIIFILGVISLPIWKKNVNAILILSVVSMGFCIAVNWLNIFFLILPVCIVAFGISDKAIQIFKEHGR